MYNSANRDLYDQYLMNICEYVVETYFTTAFPNLHIRASDRAVIITSYKCHAYGLFIDWLNHGLQEDILPTLKRLCELREGAIEEVLERAEASAKE